SGKSLKEPRKTTVSQSAPVSSAELSTAILQLANQWIATDSALNPFVQNFFARLPWVNGDFGLTVECDSLGAPNRSWDAHGGDNLRRFGLSLLRANKPREASKLAGKPP